jgi:hypothetical protein
MLRGIAAHAQQLLASSSGLCVVVAPDDRPETDVLVGRALQRAWLALTVAGLAAQPMMALPVLENAIAHEAVAKLQGLAAQVTEWRSALRTLVPELGHGRVAFILRFGYAPPPTARSGRRQTETIRHCPLGTFLPTLAQVVDQR